VSSIVLRKNQNGLLVFFYKPEILHKVIMEESVQRVLCSFGYPEENQTLKGSVPGGPAPEEPALQSYLAVLRTRFFEWEEFPHEIGFFLGYPQDDVLGFIQEKGRNYKYCGLWKVYGNVSTALDLFQQYEDCRERTRDYILAQKERGG
jgi:hypothetical protein